MARLVTILVPHYKTHELTKLCLRLIRKYTEMDKAHVIVVDNYSNDKSTEYLRSLPWIELKERPQCIENGPTAHGKALDLAMNSVDTPYVLSIHTDTLVKRHDWLDFLLKRINAEDNIAGVGSWKLESKSTLRNVLKNIEFQWQKHYYAFIGKTEHRLEGVGDNHYYFRSHCALYRTELLREHNLTFYNNEPICKRIHRELEAQGYQMPFIRSEQLSKYMYHLNHATAVLNPERGSRTSTITKGTKRLQERLEELNYKKILADVTLDT